MPSLKALGLLVIGAISFASAASYHVRKDGTGNCTTINGCVERLKPGDTLFVHAGTYNEAIGTGIPSGTSDALRVTIKAAPGEKVTIQAPSGQHTVLFGDDVPQSYITIQGFTLLANGQNVIKTIGKVLEFPTPAGTPEGAWSSHIRIIDCEITGAGSQGVGTTGVAVLSGGEYLEFIRNNVHDNGYLDENCWYHGWNTLYIGGSHSLFEYNWIHNNYGGGLQFWQSPDSRVTGNIARYNRIHDNSQIRPCSAPNGGGIGVGGQYQASDSALIYNNIIYANDNGIWLGFGNYTGGTGICVYNNTVFGNTEFGGIVMASQKNVDVRNNLSIGNTIKYSFQWGPEPSGANDLYVHNSTGTFDRNICSVPGFGATIITTSNPRFVSLANFDFHLLSGSPAIDAGATISMVKDDFAGVARPKGSAYDIGAYEYNAGSGVNAMNARSSNGQTIRIVSNTEGVKIINLSGIGLTSVKVFALNGAELISIDNIGARGVTWNPGKSPAGIYLVKVRSGNVTRTVKGFCGR